MSERCVSPRLRVALEAAATGADDDALLEAVEASAGDAARRTLA